MQTFFKHPTQDVLLARDGYVKIPFLTPQEVKELTDVFYAHHKQLPEGMYASSHAPDFDLRKRMNAAIKQVCERAISDTFNNATPLGATFMVKSNGDKGSLHPHQDWSIVDESRYRSYNIWLPLVDVSAQNGTLLILPQSHNWLVNTRGLNIPSSYCEVETEVWKYLQPVEMKAGEAFVYDHRLLHASGINHTPVPRLVVVYGIIPSGADMRYYYGTNGTIQEYACTPDFYFNQHITRGPAGLTLLQTFTNNNPVVTKEQLQQRYATSINWWQKLKRLFS